jgi:hypothetical protein
MREGQFDVHNVVRLQRLLEISHDRQIARALAPLRVIVTGDENDRRVNRRGRAKGIENVRVG